MTRFTTRFRAAFALAAAAGLATLAPLPAVAQSKFVTIGTGGVTGVSAPGGGRSRACAVHFDIGP